MKVTGKLKINEALTIEVVQVKTRLITRQPYVLLRFVHSDKPAEEIKLSEKDRYVFNIDLDLT